MSTVKGILGSAAFFLRLERYAPYRLALTVVFQPGLMALYTVLMASSLGGAAVLRAAIGSALAAFWGSLVGTATFALARERALGTLEYVMASPASLNVVLCGLLAAEGLTGAFSLVSTFAVAWLLCPAVRTPRDGVILAADFVLLWGVVAMAYLVVPLVALRRQLALWVNAFDTPFWLLGGLLVPLSLLPAWVRLPAALTSLYWVSAILNSLTRHPGRSVLLDVAALAILSGLYGIVGYRLLRRVMLRTLARGDWAAV